MNKPFPEPQRVRAVKSLKEKEIGDNMAENIAIHARPLYGDLLSVVDSILAEAGDERAPGKLGCRALHVADVDRVIREMTLGVLWKTDADGNISRFTYALNEMVTTDQRTIQGWIDRLRGVRAAIKAQEQP
jgi:hypothetical protein